MNEDIKYMTEKGWLPESIASALKNFKPITDELHLRADGTASVTSCGRSIRLGVGCTRSELETVLGRLCAGSIHSYGESLKNGYIDLGNGWRAGICGEAVTDGRNINSVRSVSSINIRIPHFAENVSGRLYERITSGGRISGTLIYSPPGEGKTTLLRDLAYRLSRGERAWRVALIDTRGELYDGRHMAGGMLDVYTGYPKARAIELATRTMNPQCLICDEIGTYDEAEALLTAQNAGVPLIASTHAADMNGLLRRKNIRLLHDAYIFERYVGIKRRGDEFDFTVTERDER